MPLIHKEHLTDNALILIWEMVEPVKLLIEMADLSDRELSVFQKISSDKRKREWLSSRVLIKTNFDKSVEVLYDSNGAPYIDQSNIRISITHNDHLCCVLLSSDLCGVDIESSKRDFLKVSHKFLSDKERILFDTNFMQAVAWCAKEALYKRVGMAGIEFKSDFIIESIDSKHNIVTIYYGQNCYKITYFLLQDDIVAYLF